MATQNQVVIDEGIKAVEPAKTYGTRNQSNLSACFPESPMYEELVTTTERKSTYQAILDGEVTKTFTSETGVDVGGGPGLGLDSFNTDYTENGVPNVAELTEDRNGAKFGEGAGAPESPYVPPLTSPGVGSVDAASQPPYEGDLPAAGGEWGSGFGADANPSTTSLEMEGQSLGSYISGRSYKNSDITG
tara:strand:- start:3271 stop:3837 length:567 start_codon:yes stop_codon:yes gene_type:complete